MHSIITGATAARDIDWPVAQYVAIPDPSAGPRMRMPSLDGKFDWGVFRSGQATYVTHPTLKADAFDGGSWHQVTLEAQRLIARFDVPGERDRVEFMLRWSEHVLDHPRWKMHGLTIPHYVFAGWRLD